MQEQVKVSQKNSLLSSTFHTFYERDWTGIPSLSLLMLLRENKPSVFKGFGS